jgi:hypothetical protein
MRGELRRPAWEGKQSSAVARQEKLKSTTVKLESTLAQLNQCHMSSSAPPPRSPRLLCQLGSKGKLSTARVV